MTLTVDRLTSKWRLYFAKKSMYKYKLCVTTGCNYRPRRPAMRMVRRVKGALCRWDRRNFRTRP